MIFFPKEKLDKGIRLLYNTTAKQRRYGIPGLTRRRLSQLRSTGKNKAA